MKIYISHSSKYDFINEIYNPIKKSNIMGKNELYFLHENDVVNTKKVIKNSNLLIAEVSLTSTGQGIELGWANSEKIPILCIYKQGSLVSSSLKFIAKDFIEYKDSVDMISKIEKYLEISK